jgi:hypothetical protein
LAAALSALGAPGGHAEDVIKIGGKTYKIQLEERDDRASIGTVIAAARELVNDVGVQAILGTESHDFSIAMTKITGPAKVLQFTGNSTLGQFLTKAAVAPGGANHYVFQTEPQEFQRSGSTANDVAGRYLSSHYVRALEVIRMVRERFGAAVLLVEQNAGLALDVAERGYVMQSGRITASDSSAALRQQGFRLYLAEPR